MSVFEQEIINIVGRIVDERLASFVPPAQESDEAEKTRLKLEVIRVKESITYAEAGLLLGVSSAHLRNVVAKALKNQTLHPIPFRDIEGVITFNPTQLLEWAQIPKKHKLKAVS